MRISRSVVPTLYDEQGYIAGNGICFRVQLASANSLSLSTYLWRECMIRVWYTCRWMESIIDRVLLRFDQNRRPDCSISENMERRGRAHFVHILLVPTLNYKDIGSLVSLGVNV